VCIPLAVEESGRGPLARAAAPTHAVLRRILLVDDERDSAESLAQLLKHLGHEVRTAFDGPEALEIAAGFVPDVVLLDLALPTTSGYDVARELRSQERLQDVRIIALSGYGSVEDRRRSQEAGFDRHLVKPVEIFVLEAALDALPRKGEARRAAAAGGEGNVAQ
jgi:DNA-binding response OmpR family regulator